MTIMDRVFRLALAIIFALSSTCAYADTLPTYTDQEQDSSRLASSSSSTAEQVIASNQTAQATIDLMNDISSYQPPVATNQTETSIAVEVATEAKDEEKVSDDAGAGTRQPPVTDGLVYTLLDGVVGNSSYSTKGTVETVSGKNGDAIKFADNKSYIQIADSDSLGMTEMSISLWFNPASVPASTGVKILYKLSSVDDAQVALWYYSGGPYPAGSVRFNANVGGEYKPVSDYFVIPTGDWTHIAWTYSDAAGGQLYINGQAVGAVLAKGAGLLHTNHEPLRIGGTDGAMDEIMIYNKALTAEEILKTFKDSQPFYIEQAKSVGVYEGDSIKLSLTVETANKSNLTYTMTMKKDGMDRVFTESELESMGVVFDPDTQNFSWTPGANDSGKYVAHFSVTDGTLTNSVGVDIDVSDRVIPIYREESGHKKDYLWR